jgi:hypothetical protein
MSPTSMLTDSLESKKPAPASVAVYQAHVKQATQPNMLQVAGEVLGRKCDENNSWGWAPKGDGGACRRHVQAVLNVRDESPVCALPSSKLEAVWSGVSSGISANSAGLQPQQNRLMKKVSRRCTVARIYGPGHVCSASAATHCEIIRAVVDERFIVHPQRALSAFKSMNAV